MYSKCLATMPVLSPSYGKDFKFMVFPFTKCSKLNFASRSDLSLKNKLCLLYNFIIYICLRQNLYVTLR